MYGGLMEVAEESIERRLARWIVIAGVAGAAVACWRGTAAPFSVLKFTVIVLAAVAAVAVGVGAAARRGTIARPSGPAVWALVGVLVLGFLAVLTSESRGLSLYGQHGRSTGYLL